MAGLSNCLLYKPDNLDSIPRAYVKGGGRHQLHKAALPARYTSYTYSNVYHNKTINYK